MGFDIQPLATTKVDSVDPTDAEVMQDWYDHFNASSNWTVELAEGAPTGSSAFAIHLASGKTFQILFRVNGGQILISIDPQGTVTQVSTLTGASADASPEVEFLQTTSGVNAMIINEWPDFIQIAQRTTAVAPPTFTESVEAGLGVWGFYDSDPTNGFDGYVLASGDVSPGSTVSNNLYTSSSGVTTRKSLMKVADGADGWQEVELEDGTNPGNANIESMNSNGDQEPPRIEPIPAVLRFNDALVGPGNSRINAIHKYWFGYSGGARVPGDKFDDPTNSKQMMIMGSAASASFRWMWGIVDGFDPTA